MKGKETYCLKSAEYGSSEDGPTGLYHRGSRIKRTTDWINDGTLIMMLDCESGQLTFFWEGYLAYSINVGCLSGSGHCQQQPLECDTFYGGLHRLQA